MSVERVYTVVGHYSSTGQIFAEEVAARDGIHAFAVAASLLDSDAEFTVAMAGSVKEGEGAWYPGGSVVDADTILSQPEVFGTADPVVAADWAIRLVKAVGIRLVHATEAEVAGRWDWIDGANGSDVSFDTEEEAARDALELFAPLEDWQYEIECGYTRLGYKHWAEQKGEEARLEREGV